MKKINLALVISGVLLAFSYTGYADTSAPKTPPTTSAPKAPPAPPAPVAPTAPGVSRPSTPNLAPAVDPATDPDARKNEADFQVAVEKCNAVVDKESKKQCLNDAETNYINRKP